MPRSARKESGCGIYHVMMRGINRQAIFDDDEDCRRFMENEARSCSMDFGCVNAVYVYRMWGGQVALDEIAAGLKKIQNGCR